MATITITVTVSNPGSGNKYYLDGVLQATYVATPGNTYKFDQADNSNSGHPLRLSITSNGSHGGGSAYTTGVTTSGTPGNAGAYTQIEVTATTVQALYYYCTAHSGMGGSFNTGSSATVQFQDRKGFDIQNFSADQTSVGQIYYNSTSGSFKAVKDGGAPIGTWASSGAMPTGIGHAGTGGTSTAAFVAAGYGPGSPAYKNATYVYNGSSWSGGNNVNQVRGYLTGAGTLTAGVIFGGSIPPITNDTEEFDGTNWTETGNMNTARQELGGLGTQTAALAFAGTPLGANKLKTESYNGSTWTALNDMNRGGGAVTGWGTTSGAIGAIGTGVSPYAGTESWDGTSWTNGADLNHANFYRNSAGTTQTSGLIWGGYEPPSPAGTANTESWNGTAFTEQADLAVKRYGNTDIGTGATSAVCAGGLNGPAYVTNTEVWVAPEANKTITVS